MGATCPKAPPTVSGKGSTNWKDQGFSAAADGMRDNYVQEIVKNRNICPSQLISSLLAFHGFLLASPGILLAFPGLLAPMGLLITSLSGAPTGSKALAGSQAGAPQLFCAERLAKHPKKV